VVSLEKGSFYYMVNIFDFDLKIPLVQTLRYIGEEIDRRGVAVIYFDEIHPMGDEKKIFVEKIGADAVIHDIQGLVHILDLASTGRLAKDGWVRKSGN